MIETATILQFVPRPDPQRINRLHRAGLFRVLDGARGAIQKGVDQTQAGTTFRIEFDHPLDVYEFGVSAVGETVKTWICERHVYTVEFLRYEAHPTDMLWSLQFKRK